MRTTTDLDATTVKLALRLGGHKSKKATVNEALRQYVRRLRQGELIKLFGTVKYRDDYDYKKLRKGKDRARILDLAGKIHYFKNYD